MRYLPLLLAQLRPHSLSSLPVNHALKETSMLHDLISIFDTKIDEASAHCDIPCGIYDPQPALYHALSTVRQMDILIGLLL